MIEVKHLTKKYGPYEAVRDISFTVEEGHIYGFLGPNGAGKSTTMNIITGCLAATEGEVYVNGHDVYEEGLEARKCIGYLPELPPLYGDMTPYEYLCFVGKSKRISDEELERKIDSVIARCGLESVADRLIANLSKGYKQRVGIAQAILGDPPIVVLDEPTVGLDPIQIIEIRELIKELGENHTVILSSHILSEISAVCDYVIIISNGQIAASGKIDDITGQSGSTEMIRISAKGDPQILKNAITGVPHVKSCTYAASGLYNNFSIEVKNVEDVRPLLFNALVEAGAVIVEMNSGRMTLEETFIKLTSYDAASDTRFQKKSKKTAEVKPADTSSADTSTESANDTSDVFNEEYHPQFDVKDGEESDK